MARPTIKFESNVLKVEKAINGRMEAALEAGIRVWQYSLLKQFTGERTGRRYRIPGTKVYYTASAAGESPAMPTGITRRSYRTTVNMRDLSAQLGSALDVAMWLERGTPHMAPRPALRPAMMARRAEIERAMIEALKGNADAG